MLRYPEPAAPRRRLAMLLVGTMLACAVDFGGSAAPPAEPVSAVDTIFVNCSGCHDGSAPLSGVMDLRWPEQDVALLVGKPAAGVACGAGAATLINPDGSGVFIDKLRAPPPCGDRMPQGTFPLTTAEIDGIARWLQDVAARAGQ